MGTTELFVELIVIGIGAVAWMVLAILALFGYEWIPLEQTLSIPVLIPFLSLTYLAGIVTDRIADVMFEAVWTPGIRKKIFTSSHDSRDDRRLIYSRSEYLANMIEYGRSRLRICRGWAFNGVLILIAANFFIARRAPGDLQGNLFLGVNLVTGFIVLSSWFTWYSLLNTQYRRIKDDANFIRQNEKGRKK